MVPTPLVPIAGFDLGERAQESFDFGSLAVTAATAVGPFDAVYRYQMPLVAVIVGLIAYVIADLLGRLAPERRRVTWLAGVAAICPILFAYLWSNYFLNELLAIALVLAACVAIVHGATRPTTRSRLAHGAAAAIALSPLLASYPHMALAGPIVVVPALFLACGFGQLGPRLVRLGVQGIGTLAVAMLLLPTLRGASRPPSRPQLSGCRLEAPRFPAIGDPRLRVDGRAPSRIGCAVDPVGRDPRRHRRRRGLARAGTARTGARPLHVRRCSHWRWRATGTRTDRGTGPPTASGSGSRSSRRCSSAPPSPSAW